MGAAMGVAASSAQLTCAVDPEAPPNWQQLAAPRTSGINAASFYAEYHSHTATDLCRLRATLVAEHTTPNRSTPSFVYFIGDSTLDNKHWLFDDAFATKEDCFRVAVQRKQPSFVASACNGFETVLTPPYMVKDVAYWMNVGAEERLGTARLCTIMTSVEESTLADRDAQLLVQDAFVRDHVTARDFLVVSY